jgi:restriction system-associated AAA family ATPase
MKLTRVGVQRTGGGAALLNGLDLVLRAPEPGETRTFQPLCLIGPNGSGKSQFLQSVAEAFQALFHAVVPEEERREVDPNSEFSLRYVLNRPNVEDDVEVEVVASRNTASHHRLAIRRRSIGGDWSEVAASKARDLLPTRIVAYTSGENETLSLPFLASRIAYADEIQRLAIPTAEGERPASETAPTPRLMLIDYSTHLEVLVANLLLASPEQRAYVLGQANLESLRSVRCIVSLNHGPVKNSVRRRTDSKRKGVQLTSELEGYIQTLQACATTWDYDERVERYVFDFWVDEESRKGFGSAFSKPFELYLALHKLALLNDLAISSPARKRFEADVRKRRFATRLPEPPEEDKVFRFEEITFHAARRGGAGESGPVDYVSLSDGEHQLVQMLGVFSMVDEPNVLFLLDEPESHLNPVWRVKFMSQLARAPTALGAREDAESLAGAQDVLITTHAPFVPSDLPRDQVIIFRRLDETEPQGAAGLGIRARRPDIQTFGASYDQILEQCFGVSPPISQQSQELIGTLLESSDPEEIEAGLKTLGPSVERIQVIDHLDELKQS